MTVTALAPATRLRHDRSLMLFAAARALAVAGSAVTGVAMPLLVLQLSGSVFLTALVTAGQVAPYLVCGLVAGALADRLPRRRLMIGAQLTSAGALGTVPVAHALGSLTSAHALAVALVVATSFVWFDAAAFGALPAIVGRDRVVAANSLVWTSTTLVGIAGPALGGLLVAWLGAAHALSVDAAAYVGAAALVLAIAAPMGPFAAPSASLRVAARPSLRADITEGLRFVLRQPAVRDLTLVGIGNSVAGGAVTALLVVLAVEEPALAGDGHSYGLMLATVAVGGFLSASALPWLSRHSPVGWVTLGGLALGTTTVGGLAVGLPYVAVLLLLLAWAFSSTLVILNGISTRQLVTPDHLQARVNTTGRMIAWGGTPFGAVAGGFVAEVADVRTAFIGAAGVLTATLVLALTTGLPRRDFARDGSGDDGPPEI